LEYASSAVLQATRGDEPPPSGTPTGRRGRDPLWARLLVIFGATLMMLSGGAIVVTKVGLAEVNNTIKQADLLGSEGVQSENNGNVTITGPKNILLVGLDNRPKQNLNDLVRADSIIILHIAASHDRAYLVSIPRDTRVQIPAYPKTHYLGSTEKINSAYAYGSWRGGGPAGGVELLAKTIKSLWGISFDAAAIVDFAGFQQVVNVLGGVCMTIDEKTTSVHIGHTKDGKVKMPFRINADTGRVIGPVPGVTPVVYKKGHQCLKPWQALDYVRQREFYKNGDYDRERHQQQFIKALFKKILSADTLTNPIKLKNVLDVVNKSMTVSAGGIGIADWALAMRKIGGNDLITLKTNGGHYNPTPDGGAEMLDDNTVKLLAAVRTDTVDQFIFDHQDLVAPSS
jgi:LCP family protein required for cell wall assembly